MFDLAHPLVHRPRSTLPVVLSIPHSGRDFPAGLVALAAKGRPALEALADPLVDRLAWRALRRGLGAVIARAPRAAIDCNRGEDEIDPGVVVGAQPGRLSARTRGGLGLVPSRTRRHGQLWRRRIDLAELERRLEQAHRPYHEALAEMLAGTVRDFGAALLLDCHSMPPPAPGGARLVIGDCHGLSAARWVSEAALLAVAEAGLEAKRNEPFAGGHIVERHGSPQKGVHALQIEIDRSLYLAEDLASPGPAFDSIARLIDTLVVTLGGAVLDRQFATAAE